MTLMRKTSELVGGGYDDFWKFKGRYRVVKGSRASKKSKTTALNMIVRLMKYEEANLIVVRKTFRTLKDSCFKELKWAINRLRVAHKWSIKESPLEMTYLPTGQKIYFRGLDDPLKITSITVDVGSLCWGWIEEAYEILMEKDFDILDESIRGKTETNVFKQWTLTFNPWNEHHWIKARFFDVEGDSDILAMTTNYMCNEWLDEADLKLFEQMKKNNPRRYQVAGLGNWGIAEGLVYENWREENFDIHSDTFKKEHPKVISTFGLDFGYTNDPSALFCGLLDLNTKQIFVFDEMYQTGLSNQRIAENIKAMGYGKERIVADSAEPKSIDELKAHQLRISGAKKGSDSIRHGFQWIQDLEIIIHPRCVNFLTEIGNYTFALDKFGKKTNAPIDDFNHLMDAMRYALEKYISKKGWIY